MREGAEMCTDLMRDLSYKLFVKQEGICKLVHRLTIVYVFKPGTCYLLLYLW